MYDYTNNSGSLPFPDGDSQRGTPPTLAYPALYRPLALALYGFRYCLICLVALSCLTGIAKASDTIFGTTREEINYQYGAAIRDHLTSLKRERGVHAVYHALWGLSSFQYYQMCRLYQLSPTGGSCFILFDQVLDLSSGGAKARLETVNLEYNQSIYAHTVPGGRRPIRKDITIAGWPPQTTISQAYTECVLATGDAAQGTALLIGKLMPVASAVFGGAYYLGEGFSYLIQTYDPSLQQAIGDNIGDIVDATTDVINLETTILINAVNSWDTLGGPGLNEADFDGFQLGSFDIAYMNP